MIYKNWPFILKKKKKKLQILASSITKSGNQLHREAHSFGNN